MRAREKDEAIAAFRAGEVQILVSTTVVEVGVDVPEATVMVIENGERFGLATLHQLRGRVGRGEVPGRCFVMTHARSNGRRSTAQERLEALERTTTASRSPSSICACATRVRSLGFGRVAA